MPTITVQSELSIAEFEDSALQQLTPIETANLVISLITANDVTYDIVKEWIEKN